MTDAAAQPAKQTYALVTGANKGIGFEMCRQLASKGIMVILGSRNEKRGIEAQQRLKEFDNVIFHQLDVIDPASVAAIVEFIKTKFGKLDILVNNAAITGFDEDADYSTLKKYNEEQNADFQGNPKVEHTIDVKTIETLKSAEKCIETNYYGVKKLTEAIIPLLQLSHSPRIVNVSSEAGNLMFLQNRWAIGVLSSQETLTVERIDEVVLQFLNDFKEGSLERNHWPYSCSAYIVSKSALNAYTSLLAKKYPSFRINAVCPGLVQTDMSFNLATRTVAEGAVGPLKMALLPDDGPTGRFFSQTEAESL